MSYIAFIGITLIIVRGTIFGPLQRLWPAIFRCAQCVGMWVGMIAGASGLAGISQNHSAIVVNAIVVGGATSFLAMLADAILMRLLGDPEE